MDFTAEDLAMAKEDPNDPMSKQILAYFAAKTHTAPMPSIPIPGAEKSHIDPLGKALQAASDALPEAAGGMAGGVVGTAALGPAGAIPGYAFGAAKVRQLRAPDDKPYSLQDDARNIGTDVALGAAGHYGLPLIGKGLQKLAPEGSWARTRFGPLLDKAATYLGATSRGEAAASKPAIGSELSLTDPEAMKELLRRSRGSATAPAAAAMADEARLAGPARAAQGALQKATDEGAAFRAAAPQYAQAPSLHESEALAGAHEAQLKSGADAQAKAIAARQSAEDTHTALKTQYADFLSKNPGAADLLVPGRAAELQKLSDEARTAGEEMPGFLGDLDTLKSSMPKWVSPPDVDHAALPGKLAAHLRGKATEVEQMLANVQASAKEVSSKNLSRAEEREVARKRILQAENDLARTHSLNPDVAHMEPHEISAYGSALAEHTAPKVPLAERAANSKKSIQTGNRQFNVLEKKMEPVRAELRDANQAVAPSPSDGLPPPATPTTAPMPPDPALLQEGFSNTKGTLPFATNPASTRAASKLGKLGAEANAVGEGLHSARTAKAEAALNGASADPGAYLQEQARAKALADFGVANSAELRDARKALVSVAPPRAPVQSPKGDAATVEALRSYAADADSLAARQASAKARIDAAHARGVDFSKDYLAEEAARKRASAFHDDLAAKVSQSAAMPPAVLEHDFSRELGDAAATKARAQGLRKQIESAEASVRQVGPPPSGFVADPQSAISLDAFSRRYGTGKPVAETLSGGGGGMAHGLEGAATKEGVGLLKGLVTNPAKQSAKLAQQFNANASREIASEAYRHGLQADLPAHIATEFKKPENNPLLLKALLQYIHPTAREYTKE